MLETGTKVRLLKKIDRKCRPCRIFIPEGTIGVVQEYWEANSHGKHPAGYFVNFNSNVLSQYELVSESDIEEVI